jgi:hypothetical protein
MATRAEQFRSNQQRANGGKAKRRSAKKPKKSQWSHESKHAGRKAAYVLEDKAPGARPSRRSTRKSSNRAKSDHLFDTLEGVAKTAPEPRASRARARQTKVRGRRAPAS